MCVSGVGTTASLAAGKIVIGTRGLGAIGSALLGSVTTRLMALTELPVTLVK